MILNFQQAPRYAILLVHGPHFENLGLKSRQDWGQNPKTLWDLRGKSQDPQVCALSPVPAASTLWAWVSRDKVTASHTERSTS